jgi:hypothetical protein
MMRRFGRKGRRGQKHLIAPPNRQASLATGGINARLLDDRFQNRHGLIRDCIASFSSRGQRKGKFLYTQEEKTKWQAQKKDVSGEIAPQISDSLCHNGE